MSESSSSNLQALDPASRAVLGAYWWRRAEGELTSWVGFQHVLADLEAEAAPSPVLELARRAVGDEYRHASWCREWALKFGHPDSGLVPRSETPARFAGATDRDNRLLRIALCCFTESVGCLLLRQVRSVIQDAELRKLNQRHLADELQHSRVGWGFLATLDVSSRTLLRRWMPQLLVVLEHVTCDGPECDREDLVPFGYFTPRRLRAAHDEALSGIIRPGLVHVGVA